MARAMKSFEKLLWFLLVASAAGRQPRIATLTLAPAHHRALLGKRDVAFTKRVAFKVAKYGEKFLLTSKTHVRATYLSKRGARRGSYSLGESYFSKLVAVSAEKNGIALPRASILRYIPEISTESGPVSASPELCPRL